MKPVFPNLIAASVTVRPLANKAHIACVLVLTIGFLSTPVLMPSAGNAEDTRIAKAMAALKQKTAKLGEPKIEGTEAVGGKEAPALYFGSTKMNNNFTVVDEIAKEGGRGMAATLFAKNGDEYIRVATNVPMPGGRGGRLELFWPVQRSRQSKRAKHTMATPRSLARPISPAMNRSKT